MTTLDFINAFCCQVDDQMPGSPHIPMPRCGPAKW
jgi:hypothetical protein